MISDTHCRLTGVEFRPSSVVCTASVRAAGQAIRGFVLGSRAAERDNCCNHLERRGEKSVVEVVAGQEGRSVFRARAAVPRGMIQCMDGIPT